MKYLWLIVLAECLIGCSRTNRESITENNWKAGSNPILGDFISKNNPRLLISNDTIYKDGVSKAVVDSVNWQIDHYVMYLRSIEDGTPAVYFQK